MWIKVMNHVAISHTDSSSICILNFCKNTGEGFWSNAHYTVSTQEMQAQDKLVSVGR
jgi:hypothetical protein